MAERRTIDERISDLREKQKQIIEKAKEKQNQLKAQEKALIAKQSKEERKIRTKHLIEIGGAVYSVLGDEYQDGDIEKLISFLKGQEQRGKYFSSAMGRSAGNKN